MINQILNYVGAARPYLAEVGLTTSSVFLSIGLLFGGYFLNLFSNRVIQRALDRRKADQHAIKTAKRFSAYLIFSLTGVAVLGALGVPFTALGTFVGLIGLGLSFALRDVIANFISGLFILINRPFKIGDQIKVSGEEGTIRDIKIRASEIKTYDGRKVIVPNSQLFNNTVINNTAYDERRFEVIVGIGYDDDIEKAVDLAEESLEDSEMVEEDPGPQVLVNELGGSSVNLKLRGWTRPSKANMVQAASEVTQNVKEKYDANDIDIPYPIRTVYMNNDEQE